MSDNIPAQRDFDHERAEAAIRELLIAVGEDPDREGLRETPARSATSSIESAWNGTVSRSLTPRTTS